MPLVRPWNRFWFSPVSARPLGAFRIVFGLIAFVNYALLWPQADLWLSDAGWLQGPEAGQMAGMLRLSPLIYVQDPLTVRVVLGLAMGSALLLAVGWRTRVVSVVFYLLALSIHHRNLLTCAGPDAVLMNFAFLLMFCPSGAAFSLDARRRARRRGTAAEPLILPWAQRLMQLQVSLIYLATALYKGAGASWADGTALHLVLSNTSFRRYTFGLLEGPVELINLLTYSTLLLEFALPFLLWFRATRPFVIAAGVALHVGIGLTVNIPIFGELMIASYLLFVSPQELQALLRALDPRRLRADRGRRRVSEVPGRVDGPSPLPAPHFPGVGAEEEEPAAERLRS
ncbi:MAG TPA: HTTM domain-containing protein [Isosphaeraceae bacterium]|nr:HTTM domain-containing protein [Isosphaeraceae bacterium]